MEQQIHFDNQPSSTNVPETGTRRNGRGPNWGFREELLLIETYKNHLDSLENSATDLDKGEVYQLLYEEYDNATEDHLKGVRLLDSLKKKWAALVQSFKNEFTRRQSTGQSGQARVTDDLENRANQKEIVYNALSDLLRQYPTILPPCVYSSHTRVYTGNGRTGQTNSFSVPVGEHERPEFPVELEPETSRRRTTSSVPSVAQSGQNRQDDSNMVDGNDRRFSQYLAIQTRQVEQHAEQLAIQNSQSQLFAEFLNHAREEASERSNRLRKAEEQMDQLIAILGQLQNRSL